MLRRRRFEDEANVIEVPPMMTSQVSPPPQRMNPDRVHSPPVTVHSPPITGASPPPTAGGRSSSNHRRGRSGDGGNGFKGGIKGFTGRLRSNSRGRNAKSPVEQTNNTPSPYESVPPLYF